jgi:hypothetical protein
LRLGRKEKSAQQNDTRPSHTLRHVLIFKEHTA